MKRGVRDFGIGNLEQRLRALEVRSGWPKVELGECQRQVRRLRRDVMTILKVVNEWQREAVAREKQLSTSVGREDDIDEGSVQTQLW